MKRLTLLYLGICFFLTLYCFRLHLIDEEIYENSTSISAADFANATSYSPPDNSGFMTTYFSNLNENMAYNFGSSCVFVALTSVLSYYDSWYNDSFIPEHFDSVSLADSLNAALETSPGIITVENEFNTTSGTLDNAINSIITNKYNDFSCYLMWYAYHNLNYGSKTVGQMSSRKIQTLLDDVYGEDYINLITIGLTDNYEPDSSVLQSTKINFIKNCINEGKPCIVSISAFENGEESYRHAVVAYAHDNDNIYANFGWKDIKTFQYYPMLNEAIEDVTFTKINYAYAFDIDSAFITRSNNYVVRQPNLYTYYCYNGLLGTDDAMHQHPIYHSDTTVQHIYECPTCHYNFCVGHTNMTYTNTGNISHIAHCSSPNCSSTTEYHKFVYEKRTNYHIETCVDCGFSMNAVHTYGAYTFEFRDITYTQQRCIYCGQRAS